MASNEVFTGVVKFTLATLILSQISTCIVFLDTKEQSITATRPTTMATTAEIWNVKNDDAWTRILKFVYDALCDYKVQSNREQFIQGLGQNNVQGQVLTIDESSFEPFLKKLQDITGKKFNDRRLFPFLSGQEKSQKLEQLNAIIRETLRPYLNCVYNQAQNSVTVKGHAVALRQILNQPDCLKSGVHSLIIFAAHSLFLDDLLEGIRFNRTHNLNVDAFAPHWYDLNGNLTFNLNAEGDGLSGDFRGFGTSFSGPNPDQGPKISAVGPQGGRIFLLINGRSIINRKEPDNAICSTKNCESDPFFIMYLSCFNTFARQKFAEFLPLFQTAPKKEGSLRTLVDGLNENQILQTNRPPLSIFLELKALEMQATELQYRYDISPLYHDYLGRVEDAYQANSQDPEYQQGLKILEVAANSRLLVLQTPVGSNDVLLHRDLKKYVQQMSNGVRELRNSTSLLKRQTIVSSMIMTELRVRQCLRRCEEKLALPNLILKTLISRNEGLENDVPNTPFQMAVDETLILTMSNVLRYLYSLTLASVNLLKHDVPDIQSTLSNLVLSEDFVNMTKVGGMDDVNYFKYQLASAQSSSSGVWSIWSGVVMDKLLVNIAGHLADLSKIVDGSASRKFIVH